MCKLLASARTSVFAAASTVILALPFQAGAADQVFLKLQGIEGSSTSSTHPNTIEVLSFSFGTSEATSITASGVKSGRPDFSTLNVLKVADRADVPMLQRLLTATVIPSATLDVVGPVGNAQQVFDEVNLTNAIITSVQASGSNEAPTVSVSIAFEKIQMISHTYNATGALAGTESVTYDVQRNLVTSP